MLLVELPGVDGQRGGTQFVTVIKLIIYVWVLKVVDLLVNELAACTVFDFFWFLHTVIASS